MAHITLTGNVGNDPEITWHGDNPVTRVSIAENHYKKNQATGQWEQDSTSWYRAELWGKQAENIIDHVRKGDRVVVTGNLRIETWTDKTGATRTTPTIKNAHIGVAPNPATPSNRSQDQTWQPNPRPEQYTPAPAEKTPPTPAQDVSTNAFIQDTPPF